MLGIDDFALRRGLVYATVLIDAARPEVRAHPRRPYRDYLRKRRAEEPAVAVQQLLREIRERGYTGSSNILVRYINQGRLDGSRPHLSPRRATRLPLTRPGHLTGGQQETLAAVEAACPRLPPWRP